MSARSTLIQAVSLLIVRPLTLFIAVVDLINLLFYAILSDEEVSGFVAHLFDKDLSIAQPAMVLAPYCSENTPPSVMTSIFINLLYFNC
jgi:hypothetical protein